MDKERMLIETKGYIHKGWILPIALVGTLVINVFSVGAYESYHAVKAWFLSGLPIEEQIPFEDLQIEEVNAVLKRAQLEVKFRQGQGQK